MRVEPSIPQDPPERGRVLLRTGSAATLTPLTQDDNAAVAAFVASLSPTSRSDRFGAAVDTSRSLALPDAYDPSTGVALGVWSGVGRTRHLVAVGSYAVDGATPGRAEVALAVGDAEQGLGLGTVLLERLSAIASAAGIGTLAAFVRSGNEAILDLVRAGGFSRVERRRDGTVEVELSTTPSRESVAHADDRDRIATVASLLPFFRPGSVAVVGASARTTGPGRRLLDNILDHGYSGRVYPVHPTAGRIRGLIAYRSLVDLPEPPDLVVVAVPVPAVPAIVEEAGRVGARALVVITAGYGEVGAEGRARQAALVEQARGYGMRLIGPNCLGLVNASPAVRLDAIFAPADPAPGPVAMGSQSGALGVALLDYARDRGLGISSFVSIGNKADVSGNDLIQYWEADPETKLIVLYLESFGNPRRFAHIARRVSRDKPVLVVKAGRTAAGSHAAGSHTAALAADETAVDALFRQTGVIRADTLEELFDVADLLARQPLPVGPNTAILTNAGGPAILAADALAAAGLVVPPPREATQAALRAFLPAEASVANPVDMIASASPADYARAAGALLADPGYDALVAVFVPAGGATGDEVAAALEGVAVAAGSDKPVLFACMQSAPVTRGLLPTYRFPESAARALGQARRYAAWRGEPAGRLPDLPGLDPARARALCEAASPGGGGWLGPAECAGVLDAFGVASLPVRVVAGADEAVAAADAIGYPVAVKMVSPTLVHKSDWHGVRLALPDAAAVRAACAGIADTLAGAGLEGALTGFAVQAMAPSEGIELIAGATLDPLFGPLVVFGLGGVDVEDRADVAVRVTPLTDRDAQAMVDGLRAARRLQGTRGRSGADRPALVDLLLRLSCLVEAVPAIRELDLNPVLARPPGLGLVVVDARIRVGPPSA